MDNVRDMRHTLQNMRFAGSGLGLPRVSFLGGCGIVSVEPLRPNDGDLVHKTRVVSSLNLAKVLGVLVQIVIELPA